MRASIIFVGVSILAFAASANAILLNDGAVHTIADGTYAADSIVIRNVGCGTPQDPSAACPSPGAATSVTLSTGGSVGDVVVRDTSAFTLAGGTVNLAIETYGASTLTIDDGYVTYAVVTSDTATSSIRGGTLPYGLWTYGASTATIGGGVVWGVDAYGSSEITLSGGFVSGVIAAHDTATLSIVGYAFTIDGAAAGFGAVVPTFASITGTLDSGDPLSNSLWRDPTSAILLVPAPGAEILVNHGGTETIDDATFSQSHVYVRNVGCGTLVDPAADCPSPGVSTDLDLVTGGNVANLIVYETSIATLSGGHVAQQLISDDSARIEMSTGSLAGTVEIRGASSATLSGGVVSADTVDVGLSAQGTSGVALSGVSVAKSVEAWESSAITLSGGSVGRDLLSYDTSSIRMEGGVIGGALECSGSSVVTLSGGSIVEHLDAYGTSSVTLRGGSIGGAYIRAWESSSIAVVGSGFTIDGSAVADGPVAAMNGTLAGSLESGDAIDIPFYQGGYDWFGDGSALVSGTISLVPAPEPSVALLQGVALLCLGAMTGRRRARAGAQHAAI